MEKATIDRSELFRRERKPRLTEIPKPSFFPNLENSPSAYLKSPSPRLGSIKSIKESPLSIRNANRNIPPTIRNED